MIHLVAYIVEKSRDENNRLRISQKDYYSIIGTKSFPFLVNQIRYNINLRQTGNLIFSLCRWNDRLAMSVSTVAILLVIVLSFQFTRCLSTFIGKLKHAKILCILFYCGFCPILSN